MERPPPRRAKCLPRRARRAHLSGYGVISNEAGRCKSFSYAHWSDRAHWFVGARTASVSASVGLRHPQLLSPSHSSTRCCPPVISSIINDHDEFFDLPVREAGSLI